MINIVKQKPKIGEKYSVYGYKQPIEVKSVGEFSAGTNRKGLRFVENKPTGEWIASKVGQAPRRIRKA